MTLRTKLVLALVAVSVLSTVAIGAWAWTASADQLRDEVDRSLERATAELAGPLGRELFDDHDEPGRPSGGDPFRRRPPGLDQVVVQLIDPDGEVVASTSQVVLPVDEVDLVLASAERPAETQARDVEVDGETYRVVTVSAGDGRGAAQLARSLAEVERVLASLRDRIVVAAVVVAALAAAAGWLIARQITRRLELLADAAEQVAATGRLDVDVPTDGHDEVSRVATSFTTMLAALDRSRQAQQRLVQDAGHELRTPLTSLRTNISVLRRHTDLAPDVRDRVLDDLDAEAGELSSLVEEVVQLAVDPGQQASTEDPEEQVDLGALVERVAERARRRSRRVVDVTGDGSIVAGHPAALERAVSNLLDNAAKFDADGTAPIEVTVAGGRVTVCDRGPGIAAEDLPLVFDRFHRAVQARSLPGSGLGLAIVRDVAEGHGGGAFAEPRPGGGACVGFWIPVVAPPATPAAGDTPA